MRSLQNVPWFAVQKFVGGLNLKAYGAIEEVRTPRVIRDRRNHRRRFMAAPQQTHIGRESRQRLAANADPSST